MSPSQNLTLENKDIFWIYRDEKNIEKASFLFSADGILKEKNWFIGENENENNIDALLKRYGKADFESSKSLQDFGHFFTVEQFLQNKKLGLLVKISEDRRKAFSIQWRAPDSRAIAKDHTARSNSSYDPETGFITKAENK